MSSFFDFIESMYFDLSMNIKFAKDNYELKKDLGLRFVDLLQDINTLMTDGFVEMVIKGNLDYQTPSQVKSITHNKLNESIEKYNKKCIETTNLLKSLNTHITNSYNKKYKLLKSPKLVNYNLISNKFEINNQTHNFYNLEDNYKLLTASIFRRFPLLDRQVANEYKARVENYVNLISQKIAELDQVITTIKMIEFHLEEEDVLLDSLEKSLNKNRALKYKNIAEQLEKMVCEYILDNNGEESKIYINALEKLKKLCENT